MKHSPIWLVVPMFVLSACGRQTPEPVVAVAPAPVTVVTESAAAADGYPAVLQVSGTEPFWGARVNGAALDFTTPENQQSPRHFEGVRELRDGRLLVHGGEDAGAFRLTLEQVTCSDGMSDLEHPYTAEFVLGGQTFKGCARDPVVPIEAP